MSVLYNLSSQTVVVRHGEGIVPSGEPFEFTAAEIKAGVTGEWSDNDPREGLTAERAFKAKRDAKDSPAQSGDEKES